MGVRRAYRDAALALSHTSRTRPVVSLEDQSSLQCALLSADATTRAVVASKGSRLRALPPDDPATAVRACLDLRGRVAGARWGTRQLGCRVGGRWSERCDPADHTDARRLLHALDRRQHAREGVPDPCRRADHLLRRRVRAPTRNRSRGARTARTHSRSTWLLNGRGQLSGAAGEAHWGHGWASPMRPRSLTVRCARRILG